MNTTLTPQQILRKQALGEPINGSDEAVVQRHVITLLLENSTGALNRVANLFSARGFNLESVSVGATNDPTISRMTIVTSGNPRVIAQVNRQLHRLIDALEVVDLTDSEVVERELCLIKVNYGPDTRAEIMDILNVFRGKVVDITPSTCVIELTGPSSKIDAFVDLMTPHGIREVARSGRVVMKRESKKN